MESEATCMSVCETNLIYILMHSSLNEYSLLPVNNMRESFRVIHENALSRMQNFFLFLEKNDSVQQPHPSVSFSTQLCKELHLLSFHLVLQHQHKATHFTKVRKLPCSPGPWLKTDIPNHFYWKLYFWLACTDQSWHVQIYPSFQYKYPA